MCTQAEPCRLFGASGLRTPGTQTQPNGFKHTLLHTCMITALVGVAYIQHSSSNTRGGPHSHNTSGHHEVHATATANMNGCIVPPGADWDRHDARCMMADVQSRGSAQARGSAVNRPPTNSHFAFAAVLVTNTISSMTSHQMPQTALQLADAAPKHLRSPSWFLSQHNTVCTSALTTARPAAQTHHKQCICA